MLGFALEAPPFLLDSIGAAAAYHDLGKLDPLNQAALNRGRGHPLRVDHMEAGIAFLTRQGSEIAAWLVRAHHSPGLPSYGDERALAQPLRGCRNRDASAIDQDELIRRTDGQLDAYLVEHQRICGSVQIPRAGAGEAHGLTMRLALSCLVDADHTDTASFDAGSPPAPEPDEPAEPRWGERLAQLEAFVAAKADGSERSGHRAAFFHACRHSGVSDRIAACEGPVGIGKTTAVTANLLARAIGDGLRHIFIVAPYTNIISQAVQELRMALVLPGEDPRQVVAEHHHRADFSSVEDRDLATLWRAPIIVTTAVQFFETLAGNTPARLRKLHELPGSAVFLDEAHAALPAALWPQNWKWIRQLSKNWGCHFIFASGSLARFWTLRRVTGEPCNLPDIAQGSEVAEDLGETLLRSEHSRVRYEALPGGSSIQSLCQRVRRVPGPRLVILNTVQTAAVVAQAMRRNPQDRSVLHLSTALCPRDRDRILARVKRRLHRLREARRANAPAGDIGRLENWVLVATSCVEAGVDISFRTGFRETATVASMIQVGGRVNRHGEWESGTVYDFTLEAGGGVTQNSSLRTSADVLRTMFSRGEVNDRNPGDLVTTAMDRELRNLVKLGDGLSQAEAAMNYPKVAKEGRVIDDDTVLVVVDERLRSRLEKRIPVDHRTLLRLSVQLRRHRVATLGLAEIPGRREVFGWGGLYDPHILGCMADILSTREFTDAACAVV